MDFIFWEIDSPKMKLIIKVNSKILFTITSSIMESKIANLNVRITMKQKNLSNPFRLINVLD